MVTTRRVDSHTHIGLEAFLSEPILPEKLTRPAFQDRLESTIDELLAAMDAHAIRQAVAFGYPLREMDRNLANEYVVEAAEQYPDRIIPFALVGNDTEYWLLRGVRGFKQQDILYAPQRFDLIRAYACMAEAGVPMFIHFRAGPDHDVAQQVRCILAQVPELTIIVGHMGRHKPNTGQGVEGALLGLRDCLNVYFETSTVRDPATIAQAVAVLGEDRVLFGSDFPFNSYLDPDPLAVELGIIEAAGLSPSAQRKVMGENILRVLGLTEQTHDGH